MMGALLNIQKVCEYDQEGNAIDHRPIDDRRQRAEETEKKTEKNPQTTDGNKTDQTPSLPHPEQNHWSNYIYHKQ